MEIAIACPSVRSVVSSSGSGHRLETNCFTRDHEDTRGDIFSVVTFSFSSRFYDDVFSHRQVNVTNLITNTSVCVAYCSFPTISHVTKARKWALFVDDLEGKFKVYPSNKLERPCSRMTPLCSRYPEER